MKTMSTIVLSLLASSSYVLASGGAEAVGLGVMTALFIAFGVLIVLYQLIPGLMLFGGMLRGLFMQTDRKVTDIVKNK